MTPKAFLSKFQDCLKRIQRADPDSHIANPKYIANAFQTKVMHPAFQVWKQISKSNRDDWSEVQLTFLQTAREQLKNPHDRGDKFRTAFQQGKQKSKKKGLSQDELSQYNTAVCKARRLDKDIFRKLTRDQRDKLLQAI